MNETRSAGGPPADHRTASANKIRRLHPPPGTDRFDNTGARFKRAVVLAIFFALGSAAPPALASDGGRCGGLGGLRRSSPPPFGVGEELAFRLTFGGAYVGRFEAKVGEPRNLDGKTVLPLFGRARTSVFVASFKPMSGRYMAMVDPNTLEPFGLQTELEYGGDDRWEKVRFTGDGRQVRAQFRLKGAEQARSYEADHDLTDILTLFYLARTLELRPGLTVCQDVFSARRLWRMTARVIGIEDVSTLAGDKPAYHVKLHFLRKPHPSLRKNDPPQYDLDLYLAADRYQTPLQFSLDYKGTKASGQLERWQLGS